MDKVEQGAKTYEDHELHLLFTQIHNTKFPKELTDTSKQREYDGYYLNTTGLGIKEDPSNMMKFISHYIFA